MKMSAAQWVESFMSEMLAWEVHMKDLDEQLQEAADELEEDALVALEKELAAKGRETLAAIFEKYLCPSLLNAGHTERLHSLDYSVPPDFERPEIVESKLLGRVMRCRSSCGTHLA